ncbi:MAG: hypothetical protein ACFFAQ_02630 [Promethearchaeota archaeon]
MEKSKNDDPAQEDTVIIRKKKKRNPFSQFFIDLKKGFKGFSEKSGKFFLQVNKNFSNNLRKMKGSLKKMMKNLKESDPKYKRYKRLCYKLEKMEYKLSEIKDDTKEIKLKVSEVASLIEPMMEKIDNIETYMKENLGSDWKILKNAWQRCKDGEISKAQFIKMGLVKVGKRFASIFIQV